MLMPSMFGENFMDDFFGVPERTYTQSAQNALMKTDVVENKDGFDVSIDLPGFKKEDVKGEVKDGYLAAPRAAGRIDRDGSRAGMAAPACPCAIGRAGARRQPVCRPDARACRRAGTHRAGDRLRQGCGRPHRAFGQRRGG